MGQHHHNPSIPRGVLLAAAAIILLSLGLAAGARRAHLAGPKSPTAPARESISIRFIDRADGAIVVLDAASGQPVQVVPPRTNGFIRGVLRGMFRTRKLESKGRRDSFQLSRQADGRLALEDPQTGRRVDLDSFGPTNSLAFAQLLAAGQHAAP